MKLLKALREGLASFLALSLLLSQTAWAQIEVTAPAPTKPTRLSQIQVVSNPSGIVQGFTRLNVDFRFNSWLAPSFVPPNQIPKALTTAVAVAAQRPVSSILMTPSGNVALLKSAITPSAVTPGLFHFRPAAGEESLLAQQNGAQTQLIVGSKEFQAAMGKFQDHLGESKKLLATSDLQETEKANTIFGALYSNQSLSEPFSPVQYIAANPMGRANILATATQELEPMKPTQAAFSLPDSALQVSHAYTRWHNRVLRRGINILAGAVGTLQTIAAAAGLYIGNFRSRRRTWEAVKPEVWARYQLTPHDHPFVIYIDGPIGSGKTRLGKQIQELFASRLDPGQKVWHEDEDTYRLDGFDVTVFYLDRLIKRMREELPSVVIFSISGTTKRDPIVDRPPDLYLHLRVSELTRQRNMLARALAHRGSEGNWSDYIFWLFATPVLWIVHPVKFIRQHLAPSYGKHPDFLVLNRFRRSTRTQQEAAPLIPRVGLHAD